jgi:putative phosphoribosyl transferase
MPPFRDREEAGQLLARKLAKYAGRADVVVLALPRGGVPVAREIARLLNAPLDIFVVRKLGVPGFEELAMGAVAMHGVKFIAPDVVEAFRISNDTIEDVVRAEQQEMARREKAYRGNKPPAEVRGRVVILVDDGIATGSTMRVAIAALRELAPARIVLATGVAPPSTVKLLSAAADEVVALLVPEDFRAVGQFYQSFLQLTDDDVRDLLDPKFAGTAAAAWSEAGI